MGSGLPQWEKLDSQTRHVCYVKMGVFYGIGLSISSKIKKHLSLFEAVIDPEVSTIAIESS
jgi:hypothetical protein